MLFIRPVTISDHAEILGLAKEAGYGMTSLPPDAKVLEDKIQRSVKSFKGESDDATRSFLFALQDSTTGKLVGTTGIKAHVGLSVPFYSYKVSTLVKASDEAEIYTKPDILHLVNDYTGASEIGSLFLLPSYRHGGTGKCLSRSRYLMLAEFPELFSDRVISEIRGVQDSHGESPFYKHLVQPFFKMNFKEADFTNAVKGSQFISDLLPKYPIYVNLLHPEAQAVIAQPLEESKPAVRLLEEEGFRYQRYIDVFDAGPTLQAERSTIRTVRKSRKTSVSIKAVSGNALYLVSNTTLNNFRVAFTKLEETKDGVSIPAEAAEALAVKSGDQVRYIEA